MLKDPFLLDELPFEETESEDQVYHGVDWLSDINKYSNLQFYDVQNASYLS